MPRLRLPSLPLAALVVGASLLTPPAAAHADVRSYDEAVLEHSLLYWRLGETGPFSPDRNLGVGTTARYGLQVATAEPGALRDDADGSVRLFGAANDGVWESHAWLDHDAYVAAPGRRAFAWEIWVKPATLYASTRRIISVENGHGGYLLGATDRALVFSRYTKGPEAWHTLSVPAPAIGRWTHIAATYDGTRMALYVNGELAASRTSALELPTWNQGGDVARLGAHSSKWLEWDGWLDEASFSRSLPEDAIAEHYALGAG